MFEIWQYTRSDGSCPFIEWHDSLRDMRIQERIMSRLDRLKEGNFGDHKAVGEGVYELRFFFGSGYRVYFGKSGDKLILLLCGGNKSSQQRDIKKAKHYWNDYQEQDDDKTLH